MTFLGWLSDPFKWLSDLQLGDEKVTKNHLVGGGFKYFIFTPILGEMIQFDEHIFQTGPVSPAAIKGMQKTSAWMSQEVRING